MNTHTYHTLLIALAFSTVSLIATAGNEAHAAATRFHQPAPKQSSWMEMFQSNKSSQTMQKQQTYTSSSSAVMPTTQRVAGPSLASPSMTPTIHRTTITANRPSLNANRSSNTSLPQAAMHSTAMRLRETHTASAVTAGTTMAAENRSGETTSLSHSTTITAVGATSAAAMYSLVTPAPRKTPPGTGGNDPGPNPDIPVPVGSGIGFMLLAAAAYTFRKTKVEN